MSKNILHLSNSTLAGAPSMLAAAQQEYSELGALHIQLNDFGDARFNFSAATFFSDYRKGDVEILLSQIEKADILHIHNIFPYYFADILSTVDLGSKLLVYQVHSPRYESPIYTDHSNDMGLKFDAKLVVGHFHPRQFPDFKIVPNCLYRRAPFNFDGPLDISGIRLMYSPSKKVAGRWSKKSTKRFSQILASIGELQDVKIVQIEGMSPENLLFRRFYSNLTVDEVVTGGYHLVSYEGLAAGNVVFNYADILSLMSFCAAFKTDERPPFQIGDENYLFRRVNELSKNPKLLNELRHKSYDYFKRIMNPKRVVDLYNDVYRSLGFEI